MVIIGGNNTQGRKWNLTLNNPLDYELTHDRIIEIAHKFLPNYFCLCDEIAKTGTPHTHLFIHSKNPIRWTTLKTRFPTAHIEKAFGSVLDNKNYLLKQGKWVDTDKSETSVEGSFYEWGEIPSEKEEENPELFNIISELKNGKCIADIINENPKYALKVKEIESLRQVIIYDEAKNVYRELEVIYLYGQSGVGKTRSIFDNNPKSEIYRITNYKKNGIQFDGYDSEKVMVFEEFSSQVSIYEMLNYLDIYPLRLPARYSDKTAFYNKVYITSNIPLERQYIDIQKNNPEVWNAFLRRITKIYHILADGTQIDETELKHKYSAEKEIKPFLE